MEGETSGSAVHIVQQFSLKWNNHTSNIVQVFNEQLACEALVDVTLSCQGRYLKAHRMILSACSPYFQELFQVHNVPHPVIIMNGVRFIDLKHVIDFMYKGEVRVLESDLEKVLSIAESLQIKGLSNVRKNDSKDGNSVGKRNGTSSKCTRKRRKVESVNLQDGVVDDDVAVNDFHAQEDDDLPKKIQIQHPKISDIDDPKNSHVEANVTTSKPTKIIISNPYKIIKASNLKTYPRAPNYGPPVKLTGIGKIPRPPNAFMVFANEWRKILAKEHPNDSNKDISVRLGKQWKSLPIDAKNNYYAAAKKADDEHKIKYPGYYYSPKEARLRKNLLNVRKMAENSVDAMGLCKLVMATDADAAENDGGKFDVVSKEIKKEEVDDND